MSSKLSDTFRENFDSLMVDAMNCMRLPGMSVALVKDDRVIYAGGFGAKDLARNHPVTPDTLYGIASLTKSFTALAIMQLVENGKIDVHDPVRKYLPFKLGNEENPITIHHLLSMSSGIPDLGVGSLVGDKFTLKGEPWFPMSSFDDLMRYINGAQGEIAVEPRNRYFYWNTGYRLLGWIIESVSDTSYEHYIKENILNPLHMERTTFLKEDFEKDADIMTGYRTYSENGRMKIVPFGPVFHKLIYAAGGLLSSVVEMSQFLLANLNLGVLENTRILGSALMEEMQKIHTETKMLYRYIREYGRTGYGYGWCVLEDFLGHKLVCNTGQIPYSSSFIGFIPDLRIGIVAAENASRYPTPFLLGALALMMGKDPKKEIPDFEIERRLGSLAGEYATYREIDRVTVVKKGPLLYIESPGQTSYPLIPETDNIENCRFYAYTGPGIRMPVEFVPDPSGKIDLYIERYRYHKIGTIN